MNCVTLWWKIKSNMIVLWVYIHALFFST